MREGARREFPQHFRAEHDFADDDAQEHANQAQAEIRRNAGNGNEEIVASPVPEVARIDRNRFRPANANQKHAQRTDQVKVRLRVQGEPPHHFRRRVAAAVCHITVRALVQNQADKNDSDSVYQRQQKFQRAGTERFQISVQIGKHFFPLFIMKYVPDA